MTIVIIITFINFIMNIISIIITVYIKTIINQDSCLKT